MYTTTFTMQLEVTVRLRAEDEATAGRQAAELVRSLEDGAKLEHLEGLEHFRYRSSGETPLVSAPPGSTTHP